MGSWVWAILAGCTEPEEETDPGPPPVQAEIGEAGCSVDEGNRLRVTCTVTLDAPAPVVLTIDGRELSSEEPAETHVLRVYRLHADTGYPWTVTTDAGVLEGTVETGKLPKPMQFVPNVTSTAAATVEHVLVPFACEPGPWMTVVDREGDVVWYQDVGHGDEGMVVPVEGYSYTEDDTILALVGRERVTETDWHGDHLLDIEDSELDLPVHHDAFRKDGRTYVLNASAWPASDGDTYVEDGVYVFEGDTLLTRWELHGRYDPALSPPIESGFWDPFYPGAIDWSHANGLLVEDSGDWLLSFRHLDAVMRVRGVDHPDFGEVVWALTGRPNPSVPSDFTLTTEAGPAGFFSQHHPHWSSDGELMLFDNRAGTPEPARGIDVALGETAMTAAIESEWPIDGQCDVQGSMFELPSGNRLLTCASSRVVVEVDPAGEEVWSFAPTCTDPSNVLMTRAVPLPADF